MGLRHFSSLTLPPMRDVADRLGMYLFWAFYNFVLCVKRFTSKPSLGVLGMSRRRLDHENPVKTDTPLFRRAV